MRHRDTSKEELVKRKAIETIVNEGIDGFTISKLAKACGISVGTPYVYYKDKEDLIISIVKEEAEKMDEAMNKDFNPELSLEEGLRIQWRNRFDYSVSNPLSGRFLDQIRSSNYHEPLLDLFSQESGKMLTKFKQNLERFIANAVEREEIDAMPYEEYWCIAFSPLYSLMRFHQDGRSITGQPFKINEELLWRTFDRVIKALKK